MYASAHFLTYSLSLDIINFLKRNIVLIWWVKVVQKANSYTFCFFLRHRKYFIDVWNTTSRITVGILWNLLHCFCCFLLFFPNRVICHCLLIQRESNENKTFFFSSPFHAPIINLHVIIIIWLLKPYCFIFKQKSDKSELLSAAPSGLRKRLIGMYFFWNWVFTRGSHGLCWFSS